MVHWKERIVFDVGSRLRVVEIVYASGTRNHLQDERIGKTVGGGKNRLMEGGRIAKIVGDGRSHPTAARIVFDGKNCWRGEMTVCDDSPHWEDLCSPRNRLITKRTAFGGKN